MKGFLQLGHLLYSVLETIMSKSVRYNAVLTVVPIVKATSLPSFSWRIRRGLPLPGLREAERSVQRIAFPSASQSVSGSKLELGRRRMHSPFATWESL